MSRIALVTQTGTSSCAEVYEMTMSHCSTELTFGASVGPEAVCDAAHEFQLAPLRVLVDLVADHPRSEAAPRAERESVHAADELGRFVHPTDEVVLLLDDRRLRREDAHHHRRALSEESRRFVAAVAAQVVPFHQERVVRKLAEHALCDRLQRS